MATRLNNHIRRVFVRAVMQDVPKIDYQEKFRELAQAWAITLIPQEMRGFYATRPEWFAHSFTDLDSGFQYARVVGPFDEDGFQKKMLDSCPEFVARVKELERLKDKQESEMDDLTSQIRGLINSCNTAEQLREQAPQLAKYLTFDEVPSRLLPTTAVIDNLAAMGWPK
jgi:Nucleotide modification associated domain 5